MGLKDLVITHNPQTGFEMVLLRMLAFYPLENPIQLTKQTEKKKPLLTPPKELIDWQQILKHLELPPMVKAFAESCSLVAEEEQSIILAYDPDHEALATESCQQQLQQALAAYFNKELSLTIDKAEATQLSPRSFSKQQQQLATEEAFASFPQDQQLQALLTKFDAKLIEKSVAPSKLTVD